VEEAAERHRAVNALFADCNEAEITVDYYTLGARICLFQGQHSEAAAYVERARRFPHARVPLPDLHLRCCELDLRLASGGTPVTDKELNELLGLHRRGRGFGLHDEVMLTLLECLAANDRGDEGRRLLEEYLRIHRRDGFAVPSWLRVWDDDGRMSGRSSTVARGPTLRSVTRV
jgi:hypothetical protein